MSSVGLKRGPGRPKGSKVVKTGAPVRRSTRGTTAPRSQEDEVPDDEHEIDNPAPPASDTPSAEDATWQVERQILLDEVENLKNKYSDMEKKLRQAERQSDRKISDLQEILTFTRNQVASRVEEATRNSEDQIEELSMMNSRLIRRVNEAEKSEAELKERVDILLSVQPGPSAPGPSSTANPAPSSSRPHLPATFSQVDSSAEDDAAPPSRWQQAPGATRTMRNRRQPQTRTPWSENDTVTLLGLIASHGPYYSKLEKLWKHFPNCHPRDQKQIKDKARNLKVFYLKNNRPLPPKFDEIRIDAKGRAQIIAAGYNPDRMESDIDENGDLFNTYPDEE